MDNSKILCIDFGSAYTKVALRRDWDSSAELLKDFPIATSGDMTFCIPSVVARIERSGRPRWLVGDEAADLKPGEGLTIYRYWKAKLFSEEITPRELSEYTQVGAAYFRSLLDSLTRMRLPLK